MKPLPSLTSKLIEQQEPSLWFIYQNEALLFQGASLPLLETFDLAYLNQHLLRQFYLGKFHSQHCYVIEVSQEFQAPPAMAFQPLRHSLEQIIDENIGVLAGKASQTLIWDKQTQFCGHCGTKMSFHDTEAAKICPNCQSLFYPQFSTVILVGIRRGKELLLARSPHFPPGVYSALAGFVEIGESLEQAIHREVAEEVGLSIHNLRYFRSHPWPFPNTLMVGFLAEYASGEILIDGVEIEDAQWFSKDNLPLLPKKFTLSRQLIDTMLTEPRP